jgi:membrane protease YdiL (CAAX protease family)
VKASYLIRSRRTARRASASRVARTIGGPVFVEAFRVVHRLDRRDDRLQQPRPPHLHRLGEHVAHRGLPQEEQGVEVSGDPVLLVLNERPNVPQETMKVAHIDKFHHDQRLPVGHCMRRFLFVKRNEVLLVLGVSLGQSAVYALVSLIAKLTAPTPLNQQATQLNPSFSPRPWLDLTYQILNIFFALVPVFLAIYLLNRDPGNARRLLGMDRWRWGPDLGGGALLAAAIGIPGLGLYFAAKALNLNTNVLASGLPSQWWSIPVLVLAAAENALLEEIVVVGYLITRLREMSWSVPAVIAASALLRGSYHLYQGFGAFAGNAVMGVVFAWVFLRWKRVFPLISAHTILDVIAFVGYAVLISRLHWS